MTKIEQWNNLPKAKRMQLCSLYKIKDYGTTNEKLEADLTNKLPKGILADEPTEPTEIVEPIEPIKHIEQKEPTEIVEPTEPAIKVKKNKSKK